MKIVILNKLTKTERVLGDTGRDLSIPIPRIGEKILGEYEPVPTVKDVIYDFKDGVVAIITE